MRPATADDPTLLDDAGDPRAEQRQAFVRFGKLLAVALGGTLALTLVGVVLAGPLLRLAALPVEVGGATSGQTALAQLEERSIVYAADGSVLAVLHDEIDRDVVELERIPEHVRQAAIAAEDRRFYDHGGYDLAGIGRALLANLRAQDVEQGGSTITQQIAKANFVGADRTIDRKVRELIHAVALEQQFSKDELLERYLNQVYFGAGAYGVAAAAEEFFRVRPEDLTIAQAAQLAGAIRSPSSLNPREHPEAARQQRDAVLDAMAEEGYIDAEEAQRAKETPLDPAPARERERQDPYVVQEVKRQFLANPAFGEDHDERVATLFSGGLRLHTTIDPRLQDIAETVIAEYSAEEEGPTGALTAIDPRNGRILALDNGTEFDEQQFGVATRGRRQPGSGFKPFVVAAALEQGLPVDISLEGDSPAFFPEVRGWSREDDGVRNFEGRSYGRVDLREATVRSVNTAFAQLILTVGKEPVIDLAQRAGIDTEEAISDQDGPAIALGGLSHGVSPLEMASAYGTFATAGTRAAPFLIARVEDTQGETVYAYEPEPERRVDAAVSAVLTDILQDVVRRGTGRSARVPGWEPAGKTGTSQDNADAWFTGYVPFLSTSVWVGHPEGRVSIPGLTGGSTPAAMWQDFMGAALEGVDPVAFPDVDTSLEHLREAREVDVPDVRRMNQDKALEALLDVQLAGVVRRVDSRAREGVVVWQAPGPGSSALPGDEVVIGVSTGTPPAPSTPSPSPEPEPSVQQTHEPEPEPEPEPTDSPEPEPTDSPEPEPTDSPEPEPTDTPKEPEPTESPESGGGGDTDMNQSNDETTTATSN